MTMPSRSELPIFIGYDSREDIAYRVARRSIERHARNPVYIQPIDQAYLRSVGVYWRPDDPLSSTQFSFTRFLVPYLCEYQGWAVFLDCDFLVRHDLTQIWRYVDESKAVLCVNHDYRPTETVKMDGKTQHQYPRKNWSSFMLLNCNHPETRRLTPEIVNTETGKYLHQFQWCADEYIGELPITFNYLEGWHNKDQEPDPVCVHFTRGGPWFSGYQNVEYADEWRSFASPHAAPPVIQ